MKRHALTLIAGAMVLGILAGVVQAEVLPIVEVFGHNEKDNYDGKINDMIIGSGMNGNGWNGDPDWPVPGVAPSTWTATSSAYQEEWVSLDLLDDEGPVNGKIGWTVFDVGSVVTNLDSLYIWHIRNSANSVSVSFNVYVAENPTNAVPHGPTGSTSTDYDFASGGWTLINTTGAITGGARYGTEVVDLSGNNGRYVAIEILTNGGNGDRTGFAEIGITYFDTAPPSVLTLSPTNGAPDVPTHSDLVITFDEYIATGSGNVTITNLTDATSMVIPIGDSQVTVSDEQLIIDQSAFMELGDTFAVLLDSGAITDLSTNDFAGIPDTNTWQFTTTAQAAPTATVNAPTDIYAISATMNAVLSAGGEADAWLVWGTSIPGDPDDKDAWANTVPLGTVSQDDAIATNYTTLATSTTYHYRLFASNAVNTSWSATTNFTTAAAVNTITGTAGGNDSWHDPSNWSDGIVPTEVQTAVVSNGVTAKVQNSSPNPYSGGLVISNNATLTINNVDGSEKVLETPSSITMHSGARVYFSLDEQVDLVGINLAGDATFDHGGNPNDHDTRNFNGAISGSGELMFKCVNNVKMRLKAANSFTGGLRCEASDRWHLHFDAAGSAGAGDVTVNPRTADARSATVNFNAANAMADTATLYLNGGGYGGSGTDRIIMNQSDTIWALYIDGVQQPGGTYTSADSFISSGGGTLTVLDSPLSITNTSASSILHDSATLAGELYGPSETYDVHVYWSTNDNADAATWLADTSASSQLVGSFADYDNAEVSDGISGLTPSTTYYYTMMATNVKKYAWASPNATFDSLPPPAPPTATNLGASAQVAGGATLNGELSGGGSADAWICWGASDAGTGSTGDWQNVVSMGATVAQGAPFSTDVTGLLYGNTYSYRVYVSNISGSGWSSNKTFGPAAPSPAAGTSIAIYREAAGGDSFTTSDFDHSWDTTVREDDSDVHALNGNGIDVEMAAGHHLVMHSARFDRSNGTGNRTEGQSCLVLAGTELKYGWGQGYTRYDNNDKQMIINGGTIIDVASDGDPLRLRSYRTDSNSGATMAQVADSSGLQLVKLSDDLDYCRLTMSGDVAGPTSATFVPVSYDVVDELDSGSFGHSGEDITLKTAGHYLVLANTYFYSSSGSSRSGYGQRLSVGDGSTQTYIDGSRTWVYVRGNESTQEGSASLGMIIETTSDNKVLNVDVYKETGQNPTIRAFGTGVTIVKLPDDGDYVRLNGPADNFNPTSETAQTWDTRDELDAAFTHSGSASTVTVNEDDDYLFTTAMWDNDDGVARAKPWQRWRVNGTDVKQYAGMGRYSRSSGTQDTGNWSGIVVGLLSGNTIEVVSVALAATGTNSADDKHLSGVRLGSIASAAEIVAVTHATNILSSTANLQGTLEGADAVLTVTAFWSTNNNADGATWLADGAAGSATVGTYTNVSGQALSTSVSSLDPGTTYYYTMRAQNAFTSYWASANATFDTLAPPSPPSAGLAGGAANIGIGTATLQGVMSNTAAAQAYICYGAADGGTNSTADWDTVIDMGIASDGVVFSNNVSGLYYGIGYNYRVFVTNDAGSGWSPVGTFSSLAPSGGWTEETGWSYAAWTGDADSGVDSARTYSAAHNFGNAQASVTVNGVTFIENMNSSGTGWSIGGAVANTTDSSINITGGSADLAYRFVYNGNPRTVQMSGLTAGTRYCATFYSVAWETGNRSQTFSADGTALSSVINQDEYDNNNGITISCVYDATAASQGFTITPSGGTYHMYALSNRDVEEEAGVAIANTSATSIGARTAQLGGTVDATGSVFTVTAYWSTTSNATGAAWLADGTASSQLAGTYTNVMDEPVSASASGLSPLTTYYYTLLASNAATNIWATPNVSFTTYDTLQITNVSSSSVTSGGATLTAQLLVAGTNADVTVYWGTTDGGTNAGSWDTSAAVGTWTNVLNTNITHDISSLSSEQTYHYTFYAENGGESRWAEPSDSFLTQLGTAQNPVFTSVSATWAGADLTWTDNASAETGYILQRATASGGPYTVITNLSAGTTSHSDTTASPSTTYYYQLAATSSVTLSSTDFAACQTNVTTGVKPYSQLGVLNVDANGGINPATGSLWAEGDQYRLVFVTSDRTNATSVFIDDYNAFVQSVAEGSAAFPSLGDVTWKVIGSTAVVDARDNTETNPGEDGTGVAIFKLNSIKIADSYSDLWDGSIDSGLNLTEENANSTSHDGAWGQYHGLWTGTGIDGTALSQLGSASPRVALAGQTAAYWLNRGTSGNTQLAYFYAMSELLTMRGLVTLLNQPATGLVSGQADLNAEVLVPASDADVTVYWGTTDGGTSAGAWQTNATVGSYNNTASTDISHTATGLTAGQTYYYTFRGTNSSGADYWATPSLSFTAIATPTVDNAGGASSVLDTTATLNGNMSVGGAATATIVWGDDSPASPEDTNNWDTVVPIGAVTDNSPFTTDLSGLTSETTYYYSCFVTNAVGGDWSPVTNFTTLSTVNRMTSGGGNGTDSWNNTNNWSLGHVVAGAENGVIAAGVQGWVESNPPGYTGNLVLETAARIDMEGSFAANTFPVAGKTMTINGGNVIALRDGNAVVDCDIVLEGNLTLANGGNASHHESKTYNGAISGSGQLTIDGNNNQTYHFNAANSFAGGLYAYSSANQGWRIEANTSGSLGSGDVTIAHAVTLQVDAANVMDDAAVLSFNGSKDSRKTSKLIMNANDTVYQLFIEGVQQDGGALTSASGLTDSDGVNLISGGSTLTVLDWPAYMTNNAAVNVTTNAADMVGTLDAINETFDVYLYWSTTDNADSAAWLADGTASSMALGTYSNEVAVTGSVSTLSALTEYYYTMVASNATEGTIWASPNASFITPGPPTAPTVTTGGGASNIDIGGATLNGLQTAGGQANAWICYGATDGGTSSTGDWENVVSIGEVIESIAFSNDVSGLLYGIEYEYRVYVSNVAGSDWSDVATFKTLMPLTAWQVPVTAGIAVHYDAGVGVTDAAGSVSQWDDQSGNSHTATKTAGTMTLSENVVNGRPVVHFANDTYADITGSMFVKQSYVVFNLLNAGDWGAVVGCSDRSGYMLYRSGYFWSSNYPEAVRQNGGSELSGNFQLSNIGNYMVVRITGNDNNTSVRTGWRMGRQEGWDTPQMNLAEVVCYDTALSEDDEDLVGGYLAVKYGITTAYPDYPEVVELGITNTAAANITASSADLRGELDTTQSVFTAYVYYSTTSNANAAAWLADGTATSVEVGTYTNVNDVPLTESVGGLNGSTTYYYTMMATNASTNIWASPNATFDTLSAASAPTVTTGSGATGIGIGTATLGGLLTDGVFADAYICYGASDGGTSSTGDWDNVVSVGVASDGVAFSNNVSGLLYGIEYDYRVYVSNVAGSDWSGLATFKTLEPEGAWTPADITTVAWFDANDSDTITESGGLVSQWDDKSGNANHAAQGTPADQPTYQASDSMINNKPSIGDIAASGSIGLDTPSMTAKHAYAVTYYKDGVDASFDGYSTLFSGGGGNGAYRVMANQNTDDFITSSRFNDNTYKNGSTTSTPNGVLPMAASVFKFKSNSARTQVFGLGYNQLSDSRDWQGYYSEFIFTDGNEGAANEEKIEGYLAHKWGLAANLPGGHAYKGAAPTGEGGVGVSCTTAANITDATADCRGTLNSTGAVFDVTVYWSTTSNANAAAWQADGTASSQSVGSYTNAQGQALSASIGSLSQLTTYYYTLKASNESTNIWATPSASFTTYATQVAPTVDNNGGATDVLDVSATLNGNMSVGGLATAYIAWGDDSPASPEDTNNWDTVEVVGSVGDSAPFTTGISGLTAETAYYYSVYVTNSAGSDWSPVTNFTTLEVVNTMDTTGNWHDGTKWDLGHAPAGAENALIETGIAASANNAATPAYTGSLTLRDSASLTITEATSAANVFGGAGKTVTLNNGSKIACGSLNVTVNQPVAIVGTATLQCGWSTTGHHRTRTLNGAISGGEFVIQGINNNTIKLNTTNSFDGLRTTTTSGSNFRIDAYSAGALGVGNVSISNSATLRIYAADAMNDTAILRMDGSRDTKISSTSKLYMGADDTVDKFFVNGVQKAAGTYDSTSGLVDSDGFALIGGAGTLTVLTSPPASAPTLTSIEDDVYGGPIWEDYPSPINYTVTFDLDMDHTTVSSADFENGGTASISVGSVTEPFDGVFTVPVTPSSTGTVLLQIKAGANLETSVGGILDTTNAIPDDTTITIGSGNAPDTTITGTAAGPGGSDDNWNLAANWDNGMPFGPQSGIVGAGVSAKIDTTPPTYTGNLTLFAGATLQTITDAGKAVVPTGSRILTLNSGATVITRGGGFGSGNLTFGPIVLAGDATVSASGSDSSTLSFNGAISGANALTVTARNNNNATFAVANTFSGGISVSGGSGNSLRSNANGALGTGDVTVNANWSLVIGAALGNTIGNGAALQLNGAKDGSEAAKVVMGSDETVGSLWLDGTQRGAGTYGSTSTSADFQDDTLFSGTGVLTVLESPGTIFRFM